MPNRPTSLPTDASLEAALSAVADALAALSPAEFDELSRQEAADLVHAYAFFEVHGFPDAFPPERWLGHRILELFAERYPHLTGDVGAA